MSKTIDDLDIDAARKKRRNAFGVVLLQLRERAGMSQEALALEAHLDRSYISLLERGARSPTLSTLFEIAEALGISPTALVTLCVRELNGVKDFPK